MKKFIAGLVLIILVSACGCTKDEVRAKTAEWIEIAKQKYAEAYAIAEVKFKEMKDAEAAKNETKREGL